MKVAKKMKQAGKKDLRRGLIVSVGVDSGIAVGAQATYCTVPGLTGN
ncbi:MAG: hypothetical protein ACRD8U_10720 [Pyrinomonadaceae bacterium]